ncbi:MAG: hypothetical protein RL657_2867 [Pseudomonadota bacterium]
MHFKSWRLAKILATACLGSNLLWAQMPQVLRDQFQTGQMVIRDGQAYAMASGPWRGTREGTQELLVTAAMRVMSHRLCGVEPAPGRRLEATLHGVKLLSVEAQGTDMAVIIQAPVQKPACRMVVTAVNESSADGAPRPTDGALAPRPSEPATNRSSDIVIRKFGGEY